ncbi:regulator [Mycobacterium sp. GA-1285]|uniref:BTAD domain-containing putative transcriptional regulator n=1 Tax=Mycobacterium sp. GA-1285 TaxID=1772282 RepID=UPI0007496580|nr:BTAD domain-containing putative transcriptional regulator [Mycobacterium sp. GA-1285]KUI13001.1 regulator [Mycobacterium sp. GA-1285]
MSVDGRAVSIGTPKQRAVLAALLLNRNRAVAADSLIDAVWGEDPPAEARASLHAYMSNLRRLLGTAGVDGRAVIAKKPPGYRLNVDDTDVDLGRFVREKAAGVEAAAAGRFEDAVRHFTAALDEWRGACLADLREFEFVEQFATALTEDKITTHTALAEAEMACGRAEAVIKELEGLVAGHPYREPLWAQLMTAYYLADRQSDALDAYQRLKGILGEELGIDPNPTVSALHERILRQEPLDIKKSARRTAAETLVSTIHRPAAGASPLVARLRAASGECFPVKGAVTRIGRLAENDVVLADAKVSRYHAVIIDTGTGYIINDAGSANGVELQQERIRGSAALVDGDHIRIGGSEFVFELQPVEDEEAG